MGLPLVLDLVFENFDLIPVGTAAENPEGEGHVEVLLDDTSVFIGASGTPEIDVDESGVGDHIVTVRLLNNDGTPDPRLRLPADYGEIEPHSFYSRLKARDSLAPGCLQPIL